MKSVKKLISAIIALIMLVGAFSSMSLAAVQSGSCGENLTWTYDDASGVLRINGSGAMKKYTNSSPAPWNKYAKSIKHVIISDGVTSVSDYAFFLHSALESVVLGKDIKKIGMGAFVSCTSLKEITLPEKLESISNMGFYNCTSLKKAYFLGAPLSSFGQLVFEKTHAAFAIYYTWWYELLWTENNTKASWKGYKIVMEPSSVPAAPTPTAEPTTAPTPTPTTAPTAAPTAAPTPTPTTAPTPTPTTAPTPTPTTAPTAAPTAAPTPAPTAGAYDGEYALGDANGDGKINSRDLAAIQKHLLQIANLDGEKIKAADYRRDGVVNSRDIAQIQKYILTTEDIVGPLPTATPIPTPTLPV